MNSDKDVEEWCIKYQYGNLVRLNTDWYEKNGFPYKKGSCYKVYYQHFDWVVTEKGDFSIKDVELAE